jgi:hypothetical protein
MLFPSFHLALKVKAITDRYDVPLIINDRVDICLAVDAAGVHILNNPLLPFQPLSHDPQFLLIPLEFFLYQ